MGLDLDEILFSRVAKMLKRKQKAATERKKSLVCLEDIQPRLTLVARAITGRPIDIFPAEAEGGFKGNSFFLPAKVYFFSTAEESMAFYFFRLLYLCVQRQLDICSDKEDLPLSQARSLAQDASKIVLPILFQQYPAVEKIHGIASEIICGMATKKSSPPWYLLYGKIMPRPSNEISTEELQHFDSNSRLADAITPDSTRIKAHAVEEVKSLTIDKKQQQDYVLLHNFEKVETAEEFNGVWRDFDGSDQLEDHQDALEELSMRFTVRVDDTAHSIYQADFVENTTVLESVDQDANGRFIYYDEWDEKRRAYRKDYCKVFPLNQMASNVEYYQNTIRKNHVTLNGLRKMLVNVNNRMQQQRRSLYGEDLDIDALTDRQADLMAHRSLSEHVYIAKRKKEKDLSLLLLLDLSLSSDGFVANNRVIDVERDVSILFGEILNELNIDFAIDGFCSKTRHHNAYITLKDFDEPWQVGSKKIGAAQPGGYTRIGVAVRHAGARLDTRSSRSKWLILLSDGKPNDYDRYEGRHGICDVRQAIRELTIRNMNSYALAIEAQARYYLPQMFGHNHYQILTNPTDLLKSLVRLYDRIKQG